MNNFPHPNATEKLEESLILSTHNLGANTKGYMQVTKKKDFLQVMKIDREEVICFYLRLTYVHSTFSANKGIYMENKRESTKNFCRT